MSLAAIMAPKARVQAAQTATLELELPLLSDSDEHDGPPPPKRACIDASGPKADKEADKDDVFESLWAHNLLFQLIAGGWSEPGRNPLFWV